MMQHVIQGAARLVKLRLGLGLVSVQHRLIARKIAICMVGISTELLAVI